ncbi:hypothetical protein [Terrarubrum flagellatum]|uniref:hypothetical protein n=1 Tax=Terrirubrum flagellatum TaxID=2895980 RepID=UPI0031456FAD
MEKLFRRVAIEFPMQPADELSGGRLGQAAFKRQTINLSLDMDMRRRLALKVAALAIIIEFAGKGPDDIARPCIMSLDEIAIVGVHHPHERSKICGRARMQSLAKRRRCGGKLGNGIGDGLADLFGPRRLDPLHGFNWHVWPISPFIKHLIIMRK